MPYRVPGAFILLILLSCFDAFAERAGRTPEALTSKDLEQVRGEVDAVISLNNPNKCDDCRRRAQVASVGYDCPRAVADQVLADRRGGWIVPSGNETCGERAPDVLKSPEKLEDWLRTESGLSFQNGRRIVTAPSCLSSAEVQGYTLSERRQIVAEYYYSMNRIQDGLLSDMESIAAIDSILGRKPWGSSECGAPLLAKTQQWCQKLKSCAPAGGLDGLTKETMRLLTTEIWPREAELAGLRTQRGPRVDKQKELLRAQLDGLQRLYPWLAGKEFKAALQKPGRLAGTADVRNAVALQLNATRAALLGRAGKFRAALRCLDGGEAAGADCHELKAALAMSPELPHLNWKNRKGDAAKKILDVNSQLDRVRCKMAHRDLKAESNKSAGLFAAGVALTAASLGSASSVVLGGMVTAGATVTGATGTADAVAQCDTLLNHLNPAQSVAAGPSCPSATYGGPQLQKYKGCLELALINGTSVAAPGIAKIGFKAAGAAGRAFKNSQKIATKAVSSEPAFTPGFQPTADPTVSKLFQQTFGGDQGTFYRGIRVRKGAEVKSFYKRTDNLGSMASTMPEDALVYGKRPAGPGGWRHEEEDEIVVMVMDLKPHHIHYDPYETMEHVFLHPEMNLKHSSVNYRELRFPAKDLDDPVLAQQWAARIRKLGGAPPRD